MTLLIRSNEGIRHFAFLLRGGPEAIAIHLRNIGE